MTRPGPAEVLVEKGAGLLVITLNRPAARNAITRAVSQAVADALRRLDDDPEVRVGIITGAGGTFCAGMDLKAFARGERPSLEREGFAGVTKQPPAKPLIAAVEGYALAGGWEIVLACDLVVAGRSAQFGLPETKRGLVAAAGALLRLPGWTSLPVALELALTGESITADRAYELGLVNRVVPDGQALAEARALATAVAANGPLAVVATKQILTQGRDWPLAEAFARQSVISEPVITSTDAREGALAFVQRRPPAWQGQ